MENNLIYFDNASKTKPFDEVLDVFYKVAHDSFFNPSSIHYEGSKLLRVIDKTKEDILSTLKIANKKLVFLSNASEANNLALKGYCLKYKNRGKHIIASIYEHPSILECLDQLKEFYGFEVSYVTPNENGVISVEDVLSLIKKETLLVSIMSVNNEIGAINPIAEIASELKKFPKICFHCDAAQSIGKFDIDLNNVDMISVSSHKIHGLASGACLILNKNLELLPLISGGGQEYGLRSGTVDIASLLALKCAVCKSIDNMTENYNHVEILAKRLYEYLSSHKEQYEINSNLKNPYIVNFSTITRKGSVVLEALSRYGVMVSSTSACSSHKQKGSYVVASLGKTENIYNNTIRVSFSFENTLEEVNVFINTLDKILKEIR